jgi:hypothetical protein
LLNTANQIIHGGRAYCPVNGQHPASGILVLLGLYGLNDGGERQCHARQHKSKPEKQAARASMTI